LRAFSLCGLRQNSTQIIPLKSKTLKTITEIPAKILAIF